MGCWTSDRYVVDVRDSEFGNFGLQDESDIVMEYRNGVSPPHWQCYELKRAEGGLEGGKVVGGFS